nr:hypothetical protein [Pseudomonas putida]
MADFNSSQHLQALEQTQRALQSQPQDREDQNAGASKGRTPFSVIKRQLGYVKTRFRGLAKNTAQLTTLFALSNLWMVRRQLLPAAGEVRP